jgi:SPP1 family predicted phage head-tail adaptor
VNLQAFTEQVDAYGGRVKAWTTYATVWAAIEPLSGKELLAAEGLVAEASVRVKIRYRSGVDPGDRVIFGSRTLDINAVVNRDERNVDLELLCKEAA